LWLCVAFFVRCRTSRRCGEGQRRSEVQVPLVAPRVQSPIIERDQQAVGDSRGGADECVRLLGKMLSSKCGHSNATPGVCKDKRRIGARPGLSQRLTGLEQSNLTHMQFPAWPAKPTSTTLAVDLETAQMTCMQPSRSRRPRERRVSNTSLPIPAG
jgi:hypothetical protein